MSSPDRTVLGCDGQTALVCVRTGTVVGFDSRAASHSRAWFTPALPGTRVLFPIPSVLPPPTWHATRVSRDQMELQCEVTTPDGQLALAARQILTVDDWGLHLALAVENVRPIALNGAFGYAFACAATATAVLEVPVGTLGGAAETPSQASPFAWPRRSMLTHAGGDVLELWAHAPLSRTEVRRQITHLELRHIAPGGLAGGETARAECRLRTHLAAV